MTEPRFKLPPHDIESEMSVLGALLLATNERTLETAEMLTPEDFYRDAHGSIFGVMAEMLARREPLDIVTLKSALESKDLLDRVGGVGYLITLGDFLPTTANVLTYAASVKRCSRLRQMIEFASVVREAAYDNPDEEGMSALVEMLESGALDFRPEEKTKGARLAVHIASDMFDSIEERHRNGGGLIGVSTGFSSLDYYTSGLIPGNLYIVAARPSMGKTSLSVALAANIARPAGRHVAYFSAEMSDEELVENFLTSEAFIDGHKLRLGLLDERDWQETTHALDTAGMGLHIDDNQNATPGYIASACRRLIVKYGKLDAVFIDYLGLIGSPRDGKRYGTRSDELSEIVRQLKKMARDLGVPVVLLAQLNRSVERREDKRPMLSDLRDSGTVEEHADVVAFLYRASYYAPKEDATESAEGRRFTRDETEIIFAKNRKNPTGKARLDFLPAYRTFVEQVASQEGVPSF